MKIEAFAPQGDWNDIAEAAQAAERQGYHSFASPEIRNDPFMTLAIASRATKHIGLRTAIAVAFPRSPMTVAISAWRLHVNSGGRFCLGLGTQVKGHNERRFSVPWHAPAARLREYVQSLRAIWRCWRTGDALDYQGDHYSFSLMTPEFRQEPNALNDIPVYTAAVRPAMMRLAGRVADGVRLHGFCTRRYLSEVALPEIHKGLARSERAREHFEVCGGGFIATGADAQTVATQREWVRRRIAFYGSTRSYSPVMTLHGWDDLAAELHQLSVTGKWKEMPSRVPDDVLDAFCVAAPFDTLPKAVADHFGGLSDSLATLGVAFYRPPV